MVLTNELFERGKKEIQQRECFPVDEEYIVLKKRMPCTDDTLDQYIKNVNAAHDSGINTPRILDYRFIDGTTITYDSNNGYVSYTVGVFLEERAKGKCISAISYYSKTKEDYMLYYKSASEYIEELERRSNADQSVFDKFVSDYMDLNVFNISPDPKPTNFFFSEEFGFTIIDVVDNKEKLPEYIPQHIILDIMGYGLPHLIGENYSDVSFLTQSLYERYNMAMENVFKKAMIALRKKKIPKKLIKNQFDHQLKNFTCEHDIIQDEMLEEYINSNFQR